jgi:hypothetical protein
MLLAKCRLYVSVTTTGPCAVLRKGVVLPGMRDFMMNMRLLFIQVYAISIAQPKHYQALPHT